jgi:hypothetical protein
MDRQFFTGVFGSEEDIKDAARATRAAGYTIYDVYSPYAVHGLESAMGLRPSRLSWICFVFAAAGLLLGVFVQFWIGSIDWPLNVGGKPFNSLPAYLPVMFELTVLIGGLGVVFALLLRTRLYPGKKERLPDTRVTDDRFVIAVEQLDASFDAEAVRSLWQNYNLLEVKTIEKVIP